MARAEALEYTLKDIVNMPRLMFYSSLAWFFTGGFAALLMVLSHATRTLSIPAYYEAMTAHGMLMVFGGLFQLMKSLSLLRAGICYGKPVKGFLTTASYILSNLGVLMMFIAAISGVRISYTLMFPLPAVGALKGLWSLDMVAVMVWGIVLTLIDVIILYPMMLAWLMFFGKTKEALVLERFVGTLNPAGMAGMLPYIFIIPPLGSAILLGALFIGLALVGVLSLESVAWFLNPLNFNYPFWVFAHNLMEAMGIMALGTVYWLIPRYTADYSRPAGAEPRLYSEKLGIFAIVFYTAAAVIAFPHHLFTMPTSQPVGLSYTGQAASWLTGFGAAFSVFNVSATAYRSGIRLTPAVLAALLGFMLYITDGFVAMQLGTIGWAFQLHGTYYATAHLMTILLSVTLVWIGAMYHSVQLILGRTVGEKLAYAHIILTAMAGFGFLYTMSYMGAAGIPRRFYPIPSETIQPSIALFVFGVILAVGQLLFLAGLMRRRQL
ncbi:MAG: cbb3-type cytochrome c oxidase subunit I [Candidatus Caldarchaeum sp.]